MPQSMLYRTYQPSTLFQFQFHTILPFSSSTNSTYSSLSSSKTIVQVESEMECIEAALKPSFRKEILMKPNTPQGVLDYDDTCTRIDVQNEVSFDDHFVDEFLDLSNEDVFVEKQNEDDEEEKQEEKKFRPFCSEDVRRDDISCVTSKDDFGSLSNGEIILPADDLKDLEWLSHFVEDCFSGLSHTGITPEKPSNIEEVENRSELEVPGSENHLKTSVPAKARSKRTRTGGRVWSFRTPPLTESSSSSSSSSYSCSPSSNWHICTNRSQSMEPVYLDVKPPVKRQKKKPAAPVSGSAPAPRRCSHCGVQKTPQWRAGPLGAKTLCNACGVRYKSGRLLPEYRPACSPTFSSELHSNHHRRVLEMRRQKESPGQQESGLAVSSFG